MVALDSSDLCDIVGPTSANVVGHAWGLENVSLMAITMSCLAPFCDLTFLPRRPLVRCTTTDLVKKLHDGAAVVV